MLLSFYILIWLVFVVVPIVVLLHCLWTLEHERLKSAMLLQEMRQQGTDKTSYILVDEHGVIVVDGEGLSTYTQKHYHDVKLVVTDLHKTLDTTSPSKVPSLPEDTKMVVLSYIGTSQSTLTDAVSDVKERIKTGQVVFGVFCFHRGHRGAVTTEEGSKAHVCQILKPILFLDDALDHVKSVDTLGVQTHRFLKGSEKFWEVLYKCVR